MEANNIKRNCKKIVTLLTIVMVFASLSVYNLRAEKQSYPRYDLLIVAPNLFLKYLEPLVEHKNRHGVRTKLVDIEDVYQQMYWQGRDQAEKLKYFIKSAVEKWGIKYVLLVGGKKHQTASDNYWIPVRYSHLNRSYEGYAESKFLSDLYFADIYNKEGNFSSWDTNGNGIYGEWAENQSAADIPDLYPDVYVGRLPCRNIFDVKVVVKKIIDYESKKCSDSWFKRMVVVAGDTYPEKTSYYDGEVYTQMGLDMMPGFEAVKLWTSDGSLKSWVDVVRAINRGCGFIWFSGHGNPASWATHPPNSSKWITGLKLWQMNFLFNKEKLPICITGSGCFNSMFNVSLKHSDWTYFMGLFPYNVPYCWSWAMVKRATGGSIATIGATAFSYESPDINRGEGGIEWLDMHFFEQYGLKNVTILGEVWGKTITAFLQNFTINWNDNSPNGSAIIAKNVQEWVLFGDPSLKIGGYFN